MSNIIMVTSEEMQDLYKSASALNIVKDDFFGDSGDVEVFSVNTCPEFLGVLQDFKIITFNRSVQLKEKSVLYIT